MMMDNLPLTVLAQPEIWRRRPLITGQLGLFRDGSLGSEYGWMAAAAVVR